MLGFIQGFGCQQHLSKFNFKRKMLKLSKSKAIPCGSFQFQLISEGNNIDHKRTSKGSSKASGTDDSQGGNHDYG